MYEWGPEFLQAIWDTLLMVGISGVVTFLLGIPLALVLVTTTRGGIFERRALNRAVGSLVNGFRSTPFIILLVALLPLTRLLVGTTIGVWAAIVPLSIAAIPFFARVAEVSLREVDPGLIEAAQAERHTARKDQQALAARPLPQSALADFPGNFRLSYFLREAGAALGVVGIAGRLVAAQLVDDRRGGAAATVVAQHARQRYRHIFKIGLIAQH